MNTLTPAEHLHQLSLIAQQALRHWQLSAEQISLIKYRENAVFKVLTTDGGRYALRIHRPGYHSDRALHSELQWMAALATSGFRVPEVIATVDGRLMVTETSALLGIPHQIDLFGWIEGEQIGSVENGLGNDATEINRIYHAIGETAAQLHNHASQWQLPKGFKRHAWDREGLVGEQPFWGRFWELESLSPEQKNLLIRTRDRIRTELEHYDQRPERYGLIHADFVPENLMVDGDSLRLIDFDDAGFGWHLFELATALYFIRDDPNYISARTALM